MSPPDPDEPPMAAPRPSVFLERQSYRRRRLADAARILPFLGAALIAIPLLWPRADAGEGAVSLSSAILYIFICWAVLIGVSFLFGLAARRMSSSDEARAEGERWRR